MNLPPDDTESRDSILIEITADAIEYGRWPVRPEVLRHAPSALRAAFEKRYGPPDNPTALADCLLAQARMLLSTGDLSQAVTVADEARALYEKLQSHAGALSSLADCYSLAAKLREALGHPEEALDFLRQEAALRRRLSA